MARGVGVRKRLFSYSARHLGASFLSSWRQKILRISSAMRPVYLLDRLKNLHQSEGLFYQCYLRTPNTD